MEQLGLHETRPRPKGGFEASKALQMLLLFFLIFNVIYLLLVVIVVPKRAQGVVFFLNGCLLLVKIAIYFAVLKALQRNSKVACYFLMGGVVIGIAYVIYFLTHLKLTFDSEFYYLKNYFDWTSAPYVISGINLVVASGVLLLSILTLKEFKRLEVADGEKPSA